MNKTTITERKPIKEERERGYTTIFEEQHYCAECGKKTSLWACGKLSNGVIECEPEDDVDTIALDIEDHRIILTNFGSIEFDNSLSELFFEKSGYTNLVKKNMITTIDGEKYPAEFDKEECFIKFLKKHFK